MHLEWGTVDYLSYTFQMLSDVACPLCVIEPGVIITAKTLFVIPISLREANDFVTSFHRHNGRTAWDGGKFAIGAISK